MDKNAEINYKGYAEWKRWNSLFSFSAVEADYFDKEFGRYLRKGGSILEVGFGSGRVMAWARTRGYNVVGVEIIEDILKEATARGFEVCSLEELEADRKFDMIIALSVLEHLEVDELKSLLEQTYKQLADDGVAIFRFPNGISPFGRIHQHGDITHRQTLTPSKIEQILEINDISLVLIEARNPAVALGWRRGFVRAMAKAAREVARFLLYRTISTVVGLPTHLDPNLVVELRRKVRN